MKGFDMLTRILDAGKRLTYVEYLMNADLGAPTSIRLAFEDMAVTVRVDPDLDTLWIASDELVRDDPELTVVDVSNDATWNEASGASLRWVWRLTNHQGYPDGVQLQFADETKHRSCVQLLAAASQISVHRLDLRPALRP